MMMLAVMKKVMIKSNEDVNDEYDDDLQVQPDRHVSSF